MDRTTWMQVLDLCPKVCLSLLSSCLFYCCSSLSYWDTFLGLPTQLLLCSSSLCILILSYCFPVSRVQYPKCQLLFSPNLICKTGIVPWSFFLNFCSGHSGSQFGGLILNPSPMEGFNNLGPISLVLIAFLSLFLRSVSHGGPDLGNLFGRLTISWTRD